MTPGYNELGLDDSLPGEGELGDIFGDILKVAAPILGGVGGALIGGPIGAPIGAALGSGVAGAAKGKKGKGGGDSGGGTPNPIAGALALAPALETILGKIASTNEIKKAVRDLLKTVPPPVKDQVRAVIKSIQAEGGSMKSAEKALVQNIEAKFMPAIKQAMDALKLAHTQRTATSEHVGLAKEAKRWEQTRNANADIIARIKNLADGQAAMQMVINEKLGNATVLPKGRMSYLGGKRLVDLLASKR